MIGDRGKHCMQIGIQFQFLHPMIFNFHFISKDEPTMFNLDPDVTANDLVEIIKEDEGIRKFTFGEWYNDIDQEIFKYGLDDGSIKMVDLLWVDDFSGV